MTSPDRYTGVAIALHWLLAALVLGQIAFGWYLQEVPRGTPARTVYVNLHKSTGLTIGVLIMPAAGYLASNFSKFGVNYFNAVLLPPWGFDDKRIYAVFNTTHVVTSYVFVTLIVVHILAALRHLFLRDGVFRRMG